MRSRLVVVGGAALALALLAPAMATAEEDPAPPPPEEEPPPPPAEEPPPPPPPGDYAPAPGSPPGGGGLGAMRPLCVMMPAPNCRHTLHLEFGVGGGSAWGGAPRDLFGGSFAFARLFLETGLLWAVAARPAFQVGPTVGVDFDLFGPVRYQIAAKGRTRLWLGGLFTIEASAGGIVSFGEDASSELPTMAGVAVEVALTIRGHFGFYGEVEYAYGSRGDEFRAMGGVRGSPLGWLFVLLSR